MEGPRVVPKITFALASSNLVDAGTDADPPKDTAEYVYTGDVADFKGLKIELFEVDTGEHSDLATGIGQRKSLAKFAADIVPTTTPGAGQPPGTLKLTAKPKAKPKKATKDTPRFNLKLAGETFEIFLPDLKDEAGRRFEIQLVATADKLKLKFEAKALLFARFGHFANDVKGAVIAFVTGGDDGLFFKVASIYWRQHADVVIAKDGMSLQEIAQFLATQNSRILKETNNAGWGEVNIICHGNSVSAIIHIVPKSQAFPARDLRISTLDKVLNANSSAFSSGPFGLTAKSRIVFRACNIGNRPDLLARVKKDIFANVCPVKAPKFLQTYFANLKSTTGEAREFFTQEVTVHFPAKAEPSGPVVEAALAAKFAKAQQGVAKPQSFGIERASFKTKKSKHEQFPLPTPAANPDLLITLQPDKRTVLSIEETQAVLIDSKKGTDVFLFADRTRWLIDKSKARRTPTNLLEVAASSDAAIASRAVAPPGNVVFVQSDAAFQTAAASDTNRVSFRIHSPAAGLGNGQSIQIENQPRNAFAVTDETGAVRLKGSVQGDATVKFNIGGETLTIGRAHQVAAGTLTIHRFSVSLRRELREDDPATPFEKRALVVPDINNSRHYGSSEDPAPSAAQLAALAD